MVKHQNDLLHLFPVLKNLKPAELDALLSIGQPLDLPAGQMLMQQNTQCQHVPLVLSGQLRVFKLAPNGREMTLFRTGPGETCLVSVACRISGDDFPALAQVETDTKLFMIPVKLYEQLLSHQEFWKDFLILTLYRRLSETLSVLEAVAFERTDRRLVNWLLTKSESSKGSIKTTHETIAVELGTAREVVSRLLGDMRQKGLISMSRGRISILKPQQLSQLVEGQD